MDEELDGVRVLAISKEMEDLLGMSYLKNNGVYGLLGSESAAKLFIIRRGERGYMRLYRLLRDKVNLHTNNNAGP